MASFRKVSNRQDLKYYELMHQEKFIDVSVVAEGGFMHAHQLVLAASSKYFQKVFKIIPNDRHPAVVLKDVTFEQLKLMIQFVYCGMVDVSPNEIESFRNVLESLEIEFELENSDEPEQVADFDGEVEQGDDENFFEPDIPGREDIIDVEEPTWSDVKIKEEPESDEDLEIQPAKPENNETILTPATSTPSIPKTLPQVRPKYPIKIHTSSIDHRYSQDPQRTVLFRRISFPQTYPSDGKISIKRVVPSNKILQIMRDNPGKCPFCNRKFKTSKHRNEHVKYCFDNPNRIVSTCRLCQKSVCDPYYLRKHMKNVHGIGRDSVNETNN